MKRRWLTIAALIGIAFGVLITRVWMTGRAALVRGDAANAGEDLEEAIWWWSRAARSYVPGAPYVGAAYERLEATARTAEKANKTDVALSAWTGIRGSILATRTLWTPFAERLEPANQQIASLLAVREASLQPVAADAQKARLDWQRTRWRTPESPSILWTIVAGIGLTLWIGGAIWFANKGVTRQQGIELRIAATCGTCVASGLALWLLGLFQA